METLIATFAERLANARYVVVSTGAGVSRESGVPTFRDALEGLWAQYDPTELATPQAFAADPAKVWDFYAYRRDLVRKTQPNPAHEALAALETLVTRFLLVTQNVDGHHHTAGSQQIITLHGDLFAFKCSCEQARPIDFDALPADQRDQSPPPCPYCDTGYTRPNVVWFGEQLPLDNLTRAFEAAQACDVMLVVGTSGMVYPAARLPFLAQEHGALLAEINPIPSEITPYVDMHLPAPAGEALPRVVDAVRQLKRP
ncbi:MAG: SIR2 family NAD-dependent protein deacylase [Anaerolineales bacterium]